MATDTDRIITMLREQGVSLETPPREHTDPVARWMRTEGKDEGWEYCPAISAEAFVCSRYDGHVMDGLDHVAVGRNQRTLRTWVAGRG